MNSDDHWTAATARALGDSLEQAVDHGGVPGGTIAVGTLGRTRQTLARGVIAPECGPAVPDEHTSYDLASLTKFVATWPLIGRAVRDGRLDLDAPLSAAIPDLPIPASNLTVTQLLSHTSGLDPETRLDRSGSRQSSGRLRKALRSAAARPGVLSAVCVAASQSSASFFVSNVSGT